MSDQQDPHVQMRERFREAAARQIESEQSKRGLGRLKHFRTLAVLLGLGVTGAGAATAVELISVGKDRPDVVEDRPDRYSPSTEEGPVVALTANDPEQKLPWGVAVYESPAGENCVLVGHALGPKLGEIKDGEFRPFEPGTGGPCGNNMERPLFLQSGPVDGRFLIYGRAREDVDTLEIRAGAQSFRADTGTGGAFLFVFDEEPRQPQLRLFDFRGREIPLTAARDS